MEKVSNDGPKVHQVLRPSQCFFYRHTAGRRNSPGNSKLPRKFIVGINFLNVVPALLTDTAAVFFLRAFVK